MSRSLLCIAVLAAAGAACSGPDVPVVSASEYARLESAREAQLPGAPAPSPTGLPAPSGRVRSRAAASTPATPAPDSGAQQALDLRRQMAVLRHAVDAARGQLAVDAAERAVQRATEDLERFQQVERDQRLAASALQLDSVQADLLEHREDLAQLELLYGPEAQDDQTTEIVVERSRRRLALAERRFRQQTEEHERLEAVVLPRALADLQAELAARQVALENARRELQLVDLAHQAALLELDRQEALLAAGQALTSDGEAAPAQAGETSPAVEGAGW